MYTDPGLASMIIAAIAGGIIAIPTYLFIARKKVGAWISEKRKRLTNRPGKL